MTNSADQSRSAEPLKPLTSYDELIHRVEQFANRTKATPVATGLTIVQMLHVWRSKIEAEAAAQALSAQPDEGLREAAKAALIELEARNPHDEACDIQPEFGYEHCICGLDDVILTLRSALAANEGPNEGRLMDEKDGLLAAALVASFVIDPNHTFHAKLSREAAADLRAALLRATEGEKP